MWPSFLNLGFAGWLAAASLPLVIHLLSRRKYKQIDWAAMRYLLEAMRKSSRRIRLEQWLLLAIRTLIILLIVLAMMQPYLSDAQGILYSPNERTHRLFVLDGSFSMAYQQGENQLFEKAKQFAVDIVEQSEKGDGFTLLLMSDPPREIVRNPALLPQDIIREIENLTLPHGKADLTATLERVENIITQTKNDKPQLTRHEVYLFSDLGKASWQTSDSAVMERFRVFSENHALTVIDLGTRNPTNSAVTSLRATQSLATTAEPMQFEGQLRNFGSEPQSAQRVEFSVDGQVISEQVVDLLPGVEQTVRFSHRFREGGDHLVEVSLPDDPLDVDNKRALSLGVQEKINVLLIDGKPQGDPRRGAAGYLRAAFVPKDEGEQIVQADIRPETVLHEIPILNVYDAIVLCNVKLITESEAQRLKAYLQSGGALMVFLGDQVIAESYNRWLYGEDPRGESILPARLGAIQRAPSGEPFLINPLQNEHPILAVFRGNENVSLATNPVQAYFELSLEEASPAQVALAVNGTDPLIVEQNYGQGRVVLVGTSADASWTGIPILPTYVPLMNEILKFALLKQNDGKNVVVGQAIGGALPTVLSDIPAELTRPDGQTDPVILQIREENSIYNYNETSQRGAYRFEFGPPISSTALFAVNVDPAESDLAKFDRSQLESDVLSGVRFDYTTQLPSIRPGSATSQSRKGYLHPYLLYSALGLLLLETLLAYRFAHHQ